MQKFPTDLLKEWFLIHRRNLPWRINPSPYRVWISEVMLQQTQASVVSGYFERWMETFPTIEALANAPLEKVLKCWEGLGYYSRARHLHKAAIYVTEKHGGHLPSGDELAKIKGIGPYTRGAILSFAFRQKAAAIDGNVLRVLSRFLAFDEEIDTQKARLALQDYAEKILPQEEPWLISEGLIELGALVCTKKPKCTVCPLQKQCLALRHGLQQTLPKRRKRAKTLLLTRIVAVVSCKGYFLLQKGERGKVMADLYEFPYLEMNESDISQKLNQKRFVETRFEQALCMKLKLEKPLPYQQHTFTHHKVKLYPYLMQTSDLNLRHLWRKKEELTHLPFSSGHKRILINL